jgi:phage gp36-like protein
MSYCSLQDLIDRFGERSLVELTDRAEASTGEVDTDVTDRAIADTDAMIDMIDGYLKVRYALPIASVPPLLTDLALAIAFYKLHVHVAEEKVRTDYQDALKMLSAIALGNVLLDVAGAEPASAGTAGVRTNQDDCRDMTPDNMKGFI